MAVRPWASDADQERYRRWRSNIPFTDGQIADAILEDDRLNPKRNDHTTQVAEYWAARCREGFVTARSYCRALPHLVRACGICGRKALYRIGSTGRCSRHRDVPTPGKIWSDRINDRRSGAIDQMMNRSDQAGRHQDHLAGLRRSKSRKPKGRAS